MDVSIKIDHPKAIFTNGETVYGKVLINCLGTITIPRITVRLSGDTISSLSADSGFLNCRKNKENHCVSTDNFAAFNQPKYTPLTLLSGSE
jgi:hypothetical protein